MGTVLDFAIALSLVNGVSGGIKMMLKDFETLDGAVGGVKSKLKEFGAITAVGGILAGAGVAGLQRTYAALDECIGKAEELQSVTTQLEIKAFGTDILDESKIPAIKAQMEGFENKAMDVALNTAFDAKEIESSMIGLIKGGMNRDEVREYAAEANAYFAQVNGVSATSTADGTVKFSAGFGLEGGQIKDSLDLITKYADASTSNALAIQQNIGNAAGTAMSVWRDRDNMDVAEETIQLIASTKYLSNDEASAATYVRNFLDMAGNKMFTSTQETLMKQAGWLDESGQSIFIDQKTGMLKSAKELENILEETAASMEAVDFNNLVDRVFGDRGKRTAQALAQKGGATDLSALEAGASKQLGIDDQIARIMQDSAMQTEIFRETWENLKVTLGKPFLETKATVMSKFSGVLQELIGYFREHPEVTKFIAAIAVGISTFLAVSGIILVIVGAVGMLVTVFGVIGPAIMAAAAPVMAVVGIVAGVVAVIGAAGISMAARWNEIKEKVSGAVQEVKPSLTELKEAFKGLAEAVGPVLKDLWNVFGKIVVALIPLIKNIIIVVAGVFTTVINILKVVFTVIGKIFEFIKKIVEKIGGAADWIGEKYGKFKEFLGLGKQTVEIETKETHRQITEQTMSASIVVSADMDASQIGSKNRLMSNVLGKGLTEGFQKLKNEAAAAGAAAGNEYGARVAEGAADAIENHIGHAEELLGKAGDDMQIDFGAPNMDAFTAGLEDVKAAAGLAGEDAVRSFADGFGGSAAVESVTAAVRSVNSSVTSNIIKAATMYNSGANLIQGFINGMNSKKEALATTAAAMAATVADYMKVQSPTRKGDMKTNQLWGGNLIQSFIDGMKWRRYELEQEVDGVSGILSNISAAKGYSSESISLRANSGALIDNTEKEENGSPIYIIVQGGGKNEEKIAEAVANELDKRGIGRKKRKRDTGMTRSPYEPVHVM